MSLGSWKYYRTTSSILRPFVRPREPLLVPSSYYRKSISQPQYICLRNLAGNPLKFLFSKEDAKYAASDAGVTAEDYNDHDKHFRTRPDSLPKSFAAPRPDQKSLQDAVRTGRKDRVSVECEIALVPEDIGSAGLMQSAEDRTIHQQHDSQVSLMVPTDCEGKHRHPINDKARDSNNALQHSGAEDGETLCDENRVEEATSGTLRIPPPTTERLVRSVAGRWQRHKVDKAFVNSQMKKKSRWSYDWQVALEELLRHCQVLDARNTRGEQDFLHYPQISANGDTEGAYKGPRAVLSKLRPRYRQIRADQIRQPLVWSTSSLVDYVEDLVMSSVTRSIHRLVYKEEETHQTVVAGILESMFDDSSMQRFLSVEACNLALIFFYKHSMIRKARSLFVRMEKLRMEIPIATLNIMLRGAAAQKDLHNFTLLLRLINQRGLMPNAETWIAFLMTLDSAKAREETVRRILLLKWSDKPSLLRDVVGLVVRDKLTSHLESGEKFSTFFQHMDSQFGSQWISVSAGNRMLYVLGERRFMQEAVELLNTMKVHGARPNEITLNIFLEHCMRQRTPEFGLQILRLFQVEHGISPRQIAYQTLFLLAWNDCLYNCCRVIWRAACMKGTVSWHMQELVFGSLVCNTPYPASLKRDIWWTSAGKVVVGIDLGTVHHTNPATSGPAEMRKLTGWVETGSQREECLALAKSFLARDMEAVKQYRLRGNLVDLLDEALALDQKWKDQGSWKREDCWWKVQHAMDVGFEVR
ncbi:hypothetical protein MMC12_004353 [Toensbergia leucococca]|nr:hypothetical protein [Toensbergia leucococca]